MSPAQFIDDPHWADFLPEKPEAAKCRHLPSHEDCTPLDADRAAEHLRRGGTLGTMDGYEERSGQIDMLAAIVRAFDNRRHLMIEAGTGVGKSLAYLIPSILWANLNDTPVIVSTATRNLQSQLIGSDIPRALKVLGEDAARFKVALLKGRANYLCLRALDEFFASGYWTMSAEEQAEMPHLIEFLRTTPDGDLDRYDGLSRARLTCPGEECSGRRCPFYTRCFVYRARKNAAEAHLVIVNHALVLAEATNPGAGILPPSGRLVLDEAHNLEEVATDYLSREFSRPALARIVNRLAHKGRGRRARPGGVLANVQRLLQKGAIDGDAALRIGRILNDAAGVSVRVHNAAEDLSRVAERLLGPGRKHDVMRYRVAAGKRQHSVGGLFRDYDGDVWDEGALIQSEHALENALADLVKILHDLADALGGAASPDQTSPGADLATQLMGLAESIVAFANDTHFVLSADKDTHAFWAERVRTVNRPTYVRLVAAPLSVADDLRKLVFDVKDSVILSSATLRVGNDFRYMMRRLGFDAERGDALVAASPFDYLRQALVLAPDWLPDPSSGSGGYEDALAKLLDGLVGVMHGRTLVLFTSYEMMRDVAERFRDRVAGLDVELLVQGEGLSREAITARLREADHPVVVFGAQSFWEGVDVAGEALSCVVLARLPFAQRADPIVEARSEQIDRAGGSSFRDYYLPEAVIRFRQGFGRLIRTKRDRGVVVVGDPRLVTKSYGAIFRRSIPASVHTVTAPDDLLDRMLTFVSA